MALVNRKVGKSVGDSQRNLIRELRDRLGMSQVEFGLAIGRSFQSVRAYEKHPADIPADVIDRIRALASDHGHPDLARQLAGDDRQPVETARPTGHRHQEWHDLLDEILDSGDPDAAPAVRSNLITFAKYIRNKRSSGGVRRKA